MKTAEKFGHPIIAFIDTPGAYPGIGAEERGQAEAIAHNLREMAGLRVPTLSVVTGEGASGGALGIGVTDRILILENAFYSVISPEGCAAILWKDGEKRELAARAMKITAEDLERLGVVDEIVPEPLGGAHADYASVARAIAEGALEPWAGELAALARLPNVACKLSGLVTEARWDDWDADRIRPYADHVLTVFGPDRVMFGSDWPVCRLAASYGEVRELAQRQLRLATLLAQVAAQVLHGLADTDPCHPSIVLARASRCKCAASTMVPDTAWNNRRRE